MAYLLREDLAGELVAVATIRGKVLNGDQGYCLLPDTFCHGPVGQSG